MPTTYRIDDKAEIVYFLAIGTTTEEDWGETRSQISADPLYRPGMSVLVDAREHESLLSTAFIKRTTEDLKARFEPADVPRWAIVVTRRVAYGLGRMFALLAETGDIDVRVFRDIDDAEKWLRDTQVS
jgi:crotonobetainyl-CoA:carnitine CoA-transferase CaiB-like acyl-CoA transferase